MWAAVAAATLCAPACAAVLLGDATPARAATQRHGVSLLSNLYAPGVVRISPGDTVVWTAIDQQHTVIAEDNRFMYFPLRELDRGQQVSYTFLREETVPYYCRVHGGRGGFGMSGFVIVGDGGSEPAPDPRPAETRTVPSAAYPTIGAALGGIPPESQVLVMPGTYRESVVVTTPGVVIRGMGATPDDVVVDGQSLRPTGVLVAASSVVVLNLSTRDHTGEGIALRGAAHAGVRDVRAAGAGDYGILVADSIDVSVSRVHAAGAGVAGVSVKGCTGCGVTISDSVMEDNMFGVLVDNAGAEIRDNMIRGNATGIAVRSLATQPGVTRDAVRVIGNDISANRAAIPARPPTEFAVSGGVWLAGAAGDVVEGNRIDGHDYGVFVTSFGVPSLGARVLANQLSGSTKADLAWDGIGAGVCFAGNTSSPSGGQPSSRPPLAQTVYACGRPGTAGIAEPLVIADLAAYAAAGSGLP